MKSFLKSVIPAMLVILFTYAASSKLMDTGRFHKQLYLQPFPHLLADILVYLLPGTEIMTAILLCTLTGRKAGLILSAILMALFTGYISYLVLNYQGRLPCSCGGILNHMTWSMHLVFNWIFLIAAITGVLLEKIRDTRTA